jgi:2,3-bisphosphoglycerate-dependent phosphoglycerate mutase
MRRFVRVSGWWYRAENDQESNRSNTVTAEPPHTKPPQELKRAMQLYIIRHGESANNALGTEDTSYDEYMAARSPDPVLTEIGERQAELVGAHLAEAGYGITELHCSAMVRAMQTALPIGQALDLQPRVWVDIHEHGGMFLGNPRNGDGIRSFPGISRREASERFPGYTLPEEMSDDGWWHGDYEDMESCAVRAQRVAEVLEERAAEDDDSAIALVTHGTFIDQLLKALTKQTETDRRIFYFKNNTAITHVDFLRDGRLVLRYTNRIPHLPDELITR